MGVASTEMGETDNPPIGLRYLADFATAAGVLSSALQPLLFGWAERMKDPRVAAFIVAAKRASATPDAPEYSDLLTNLGMPSDKATFLANLIVHCGLKVHQEYLAERLAAGHLRKIAKATTSLVLQRRAKSFVEAMRPHGGSGALREVCDLAGLSYLDLGNLLERAVRRDETVGEALRKSADDLLVHLLDPRGRAPNPTNSVHEILLHVLSEFGKPRSFTYSDEQEAFVDPQTRATARVFGQTDFDPRVACRNFRKRSSQKSDPAMPTT